MPKAEFHLHIEGTREPEHMMSLARRNGVSLPLKTIEEIRQSQSKGVRAESFCKKAVLPIQHLGSAPLD